MASARGTLLLVSASTWSALGLGMRAALRAPSPLMVATSPSAAAPVGIEPQRHTVALVRMQDPMIAPPPRAVHPASAYAELRTPAPQVALGCPKNTVDAEVMLGDLQRNGLRVVSEPCDAEVVIVNTCAFVEDAKRESISAIMSAARLKEDRSTPVRALYVTGCMAQRYADELAEELPEVDAIVGFESYAQIPEQVLRLLSSDASDSTSATRAKVLVGAASVPFRPETDRFQLTPAHTAYLRVAEGCDHACSFCAIPGFRGSFRSKPFDTALAEAQMLVARGVRELNLIAEDTNQFGSDWGEADGRRLSDFLRALEGLEGLRWIRLLYCYPSYFSDDLVGEIARNPKVVKYIDIPLQHMDASVLQRMRRPGAAATTALLERLRAQIPGLALRTTFICGFPGETEAEHRTLVKEARRFGFERGGAFAYSPEDGTPAADLPGQLDDEVKQARKDELVSLFQMRSEEWAEAQVGSILRVMVDRMDGTDAVGRTEFDAIDIDGTVRIPAMPLAPGTVVRARIVAADGLDLIAEVVR